MLVRSFDQIVSRICVDLRQIDRASFSAARSLANRALGAVVAFADQEPVPLRRKIRDHAGGNDFVRRKHHAADDQWLRDRGAQPAAGIEESQIRHRRMLWESPISYHQGTPFCANTTAESSPSSG